MVGWYLIHQFCKMFATFCDPSAPELEHHCLHQIMLMLSEKLHILFLNLSRFRVYKKLIIGFSKLQPQPSSSSSDKVRVVFIMDSFSAPAAVPLQKWLIQIFSSNSTQVGEKKEKVLWLPKKQTKKSLNQIWRKYFKIDSFSALACRKLSLEMTYKFNFSSWKLQNVSNDHTNIL